jgi:hypothetical protein
MSAHAGMVARCATTNACTAGGASLPPRTRWLQLCSVRADTVLHDPGLRGVGRRGWWVNWRRRGNSGTAEPRNPFAPHEFLNFEGVVAALRHDLSRHGLELVSLATVLLPRCGLRREFMPLAVEVRRKKFQHPNKSQTTKSQITI